MKVNAARTFAKVVGIGLLLIASALPLYSSEKLIYAVIHKGPASFAPKMTEIYSVDPETGERHLLFSDEKTPIVIATHLFVFHFPVIGDGKLFAHASERGKLLDDYGNASLYELSLDGSNSFRRIAPVRGLESLGDIFATRDGTRVGYILPEKNGRFLSEFDVATGALVHHLDVSKLLADTYVSSVGWMPAGDKLYISAEVIDPDAVSEEAFASIGSYLLGTDGKSTKLATNFQHDDFWPPESERIVGELPTGELLFEVMQYPKPGKFRSKASMFRLLRFDPKTLHATEIMFSKFSWPSTTTMFCVSPSGRFLAMGQLPVPASEPSGVVWIKNLETGEEKQLFSLPNDEYAGPFLGLVGWIKD